jgi:hypothetical protein
MSNQSGDITRPIIGIAMRTGQEVFEIMCGRIALAKPAVPHDPRMCTLGRTGAGSCDGDCARDYSPSPQPDPKDLGWRIPENLHWLAQQDHRPDRLPCGMLFGQFLNLVASLIEKSIPRPSAQPVEGDAVAWMYEDKYGCRRVWLNRQSLSYVQAEREIPLYADPAKPCGNLADAVTRFLADHDDGDRADAGTNPLMLAHIADFRAALATPTHPDWPTIWEDPAGKGYPCFERPMTIKEINEAVSAQPEVAALVEALRPFAIDISDHVPDDFLMEMIAWTAGDFRKLRSALAAAGGKA